MRKWIPVALIALAILWFLLTNVGSTQALADIGARPILALVKDGQRTPVQQAGQPAAPDLAQPVSGAGIQFGYRFDYRLPDGEVVVCTLRFSSLSCSNGWTAERKG